MKRRNTATKEAVLSVLNSSGKAMSQGAIEKRIGVDINRATIYRVLNRYCDDGVLHARLKLTFSTNGFCSMGSDCK